MPLTIKVHAGDWGETRAGFGPGWSGEYRLIFPERGGGNSTYLLTKDVATVETANEESVKKLAGTAGWGIAGAALLGPVGLLAGLLLGGRKKEVTFICVFKDGKKILATTDSKTYTKFQAAAF